MIEFEIRGEFSLGQVVATKNTVVTLDPTDILAAIQRHSHCYWGELSDEDRVPKDLSLEIRNDCYRPTRIHEGSNSG